MRTDVRLVERAGWEVVRMTCPPLEADVVPAKGGDILAVRWLPLGINLLWESPWGLTPRSARRGPVGDSVAAFLDAYPGGWQTLFPNGGDACVERGVEWGFHGEACLAEWTHTVVPAEADGSAIELRTRLSSCPFELTKRIALDPRGLTVAETARNTSAEVREVMWSHHPAFGAPLVSGSARVATSASTFVADDARDVPAGDLQPGASSSWPHALTRGGDKADLGVLPPDGPPVDRFGYLTGFAGDAWASITNPDLGLEVRLDWDASVFGSAWYWLEARATQEYPWFGKAYVFAVEPASTWPGQGIAAARTKGNGPLRFSPGEAKTIEIRLAVTPR